MPEVFINYRTGDGERTATLIERDLSHRFGDAKTFRASKSIKSGEAYPQALISHIRRSSVVFAVIGPTWTTWPQLHREHDWVRRELLEALNEEAITLIPVIDGRDTARLRREDLPEALGGLADLQSERFDTRTAGQDLDALAKRVTELIPELAEFAGQSDGPGTDCVRNSATDVDGTAVQGRDITGDVGTVIKNAQGPVHTGRGNQYTSTYHDSVHQSGPGAVHISGDNNGGFHQGFGDWRGDQDRER